MDEDDYVMNMIEREAVIDEENFGSQQRGVSQDGRALVEESNLYDDPNNVNNLSRVAKWLPTEWHQENTNRDGNMTVFISRADGPMWSAKCKEQIMALNYIMQNAPHRRRVLRTGTLVPTFDSDEKLTVIMERTSLSPDDMDIMQGARDDIGNTRVDAIPLDKVSYIPYFCHIFVIFA
jgi:hypothetical protein